MPFDWTIFDEKFISCEKGIHNPKSVIKKYEYLKISFHRLEIGLKSILFACQIKYNNIEIKYAIVLHNKLTANNCISIAITWNNSKIVSFHQNIIEWENGKIVNKISRKIIQIICKNDFFFAWKLFFFIYRLQAIGIEFEGKKFFFGVTKLFQSKCHWHNIYNFRE